MLAGFIVFAPFAVALIVYMAGAFSEKVRDALLVISTVIELILAFILAAGAAGESAGILDLTYVFDTGLHLRAGGFHSVYCVITALMWAVTSLFSLDYFRHERENLSRYYLFILMTLGATEGVMLSGDLVTAYMFFEILSLTSFTWVIHEGTKEAMKAAYTYLTIAIIGGLVLFFGMVIIRYFLGTLMFDELLPAAKAAGLITGSQIDGRLFAAGVCVLLGFGCKAGMFPVHVWLPKAHPVAPSPASALLSGILTKVGIYGILMTSIPLFSGITSFGYLVLILGTITMALGAVLALFSVNLKRTLACSSMSQIGFILIGIGMAALLGEEAETALSGAMLHMVNHSLLKLSLFCLAGVVVMNAHSLDLNEVRGFGRRNLLLELSFLLALLGISGVPLFNGYASKTLLHEAILEYSRGGALLTAIEWIFLISGGCTFAYMLKLFICLFIEKNEDAKRQAVYDGMTQLQLPSVIAVFVTAVLFPVLGQKAVFGRLAEIMTGGSGVLDHFSPLAWNNLKGGLISLLIGALIYLFVVRKLLMQDGRYVNRWPEWLDLENLIYRPVLLTILPAVFGRILRVFGDNEILRAPEIKGSEGENVLLRRYDTMLLAIIARAMATGTDALIALLRRTVIRERVVSGRELKQMNPAGRIVYETEKAYKPIVQNFSFALMTSCIGILIILAVLLLYIA